jgi:5-methylcytosine-specific restriction endonuclease McrA
MIKPTDNDGIKKKKKEYYEKNKEKIIAKHNKYIIEHPEIRRKIFNTYYKKNVERFTHYKRTRRAKIHNSEGNFTLQEWEQMKKDFNYSCAYCGLSEPQIKLEPDHKKSIFDGGANVIKNITPACRHCNAVKNKKSIKEVALKSISIKGGRNVKTKTKLAAGSSR